MYKLLIADDEPLEREALRFFVEGSRLAVREIIECANGIEALSRAMAEKPEICILDIKMPGLSGHEVLEQVKLANPGCKIILSTAYSYFNYALKALQLGAFDFLVKPVQKETVVRTINKAIDQLDEERNARQRTGHLHDVANALERRILGELLGGEVSDEALWFLDSKGHGGVGSGCSYFVRLGPETEGATRKAAGVLRKGLEQAGLRCIVADSAATISLLLFSEREQALASLHETLRAVLESAAQGEGLAYELGVGAWFDELESAAASYAVARAAMGDLRIAEEMENAAIPAPALPGASEAPAEVDALRAYIKANYTEKLTLDILSREVGFSKYYISRLFKQHTGTTIMDYLIEVRMKKAKQLLRDSDQSIKQISFDVGYTDPNYFTWSFKKYEGISPVKYRYQENEPKAGAKKQSGGS